MRTSTAVPVLLPTRVDASIGAVQRCKHQCSTAQRFRLADRRYGDVQSLARFGKGRQFGGHHDGGGIFKAGVDAGRDGEAQARYSALHALRCINQAIIAGPRKADNDAISGQLVGAQALELAKILHPLSMKRGGEGGTRGQQDGEQAHHQNGLIFEKKRCSQPCLLARAISPLPE